MASEINFDCPKCQASLSAPGQFVGKQIQCPDCGQQVGVPEADSGSDWMLSGLSDEPESDIPDTLKIDGISSDSHGGVSWDITCDVCDSVLLVNLEQVGSKIKCTDCHSLLEVQPPEEQQMLDQIADSSASEPTDDFSVDSVAEEHDELFDDLMLAPAVDLPNEVTELQSENYFGQFDEPELEAEQNESSSQQLHPPLAVPMVAQQDDDDDEMIEVLDVPPEQLNRPKAKKVVKQVSQEADDDDDAPVRVFAKKRRKSKKSSGSDSKSEAQFDFDKASFGEVTDKAVDVLKSPSVMIWAVAATVIMAIGSAIWHGLGVSDLDPETTEMGSRLIQSGVGFLFGHGVFLLGYVILLFVGGVILRETAQGRTQIESVSCTGVPDFSSTMLLFGFSMFIAASPWVMIGWMFLTLPLQFLLAGIFLFSAWKNQSPFMIVSGDIFESLSSKQLGRWMHWLSGALIAAVAGIVGGGLMEVSLPILSIFTSVVGAILITLATLFYAAVTGWHCGNLVEQ